MTSRKTIYPYIAVLFLLGFLAPLVLKEFHVYMLTEIIIFALLAPTKRKMKRNETA